MIIKFFKLVNLILLNLFNFKLLRFNNHYNGTCVIKSKNKFKKISFSKYGKGLIKNEIRGYNWYLSRIGLPNILKFRENYMFPYIQTDQFQGSKASYKKNIIYNTKYITLAFKHYEKVWNKNDKAVCHGDLTFENIIFDTKKNKTYFIDWENFKDKKEIWGYDIVYLLLSSLILPNLDKNKIKPQHRERFFYLWKKIRKKIKSKKMKKNPYIFIEDRFKKDKFWIKLKLKAPKKFFINVISDQLRLEVIKIFDM